MTRSKFMTKEQYMAALKNEVQICKSPPVFNAGDLVVDRFSDNPDPVIFFRDNGNGTFDYRYPWAGENDFFMQRGTGYICDFVHWVG